MPLPGGPQPKEAWGFEKRACSLCHEPKGGSPYRLCKCQRDEHGLGDKQPHLAADVPKFKRGDWVAQTDTPQPHFGVVREVYQDGLTDEWLVDLSLWTWDGQNPGRISPALDGPKTYEPCCPATNYRKIAKPEFPLKRGLGGDYDQCLEFNK